MHAHVKADVQQTASPEHAVIYTWLDKAKEDDSVCFVGADSLMAYFARRVYDYDYVKWFKSDPDRWQRFIMCGIQEANAALIAAGLAAEGYKVYWQDMAWLFERAYQMIAYSVCIERYNVTFIGRAGGIGGLPGTTHHNLRDIATFNAIPNMIVTAAADATEAQALARFAYEYHGPIYIRVASTAHTLFDDGYQFHLGEAPVVRDGADITVIGMQEWVYNALQAAEQLAHEDIDVRVIDMSTIKPIDKPTIERAARETGAVVTAESTNIHGGLGSAVTGVIGETYPVPTQRLALHDLFTHSSSGDLTNAYYHQTVPDLVATIKATLSRKR